MRRSQCVFDGGGCGLYVGTEYFREGSRLPSWACYHGVEVSTYLGLLITFRNRLLIPERTSLVSCYVRVSHQLRVRISFTHR
jgi:hypothetical protein